MNSKDVKTSSDVIVLDDDDNMDTTEAAKNSKCINYSCKSGVDLMKPPVFCLSYYRIKGKAKGQPVCKVCHDIAAVHFEMLGDTFKSGKSLLTVAIPNIHETFALDSDSDDDENDEEVMLDPKTLEFIAEHFDEVLEECDMKYDYTTMMKDTLIDLNQRVEATSDSLLEVKTMSESVRNKFDIMLYELSNALRVDNKELSELIIQDVEEPIVPPAEQKVEFTPLAPKNLPKRAPLIRPQLRLGQYYYARKTDAGLASWVKVKLENIIPPGSKINDIVLRVTMYQVCRQLGLRENRRFVDGRSIAFSTPLMTMLEIGTRVIALFHEVDVKKHESYYPGIVGEFPSAFNNFRYLIFFDDGYAFYVGHNDVYMIYECSKDVWEDVYHESRAFIKKYLTEYPNRSMVKLLTNQTVRTEYRGKWYMTTVMEVDCSLVMMHFDTISRTEWIYRGSRRLNTMYQEEQAVSNRLQHKQRNARARNRPAHVSGAPYVQYSSVRDDTDVVFVSQSPVEKPEQRAVAKKSTRPSLPTPSTQVPSAPRLVQPTREEPTPGKIVYYTPRKQCPTKQVYGTHKCNPACQKYLQQSLKRLKGYGPLAKPLLCGFHRIQYKAKSRKQFIMYKTPCGRTTRNMDELHRYLRLTESDFTVDLFNFEPWVRCLAEFRLDANATLNADLSDGQELIQIPVVNYIDNKTIDFVNYSTKRMPLEGVNLNLDPSFLCGCDCEDDCRDKTKCACWRLTVEGASFLHRGEYKDPADIGYVHRRLMDPVVTGIYECNSRCKCAKTCLNRVVQNPLQHKLQVFMTYNRGWGIRCINDIPKGAFICIYAGSLLTDQMANEGGQNVSDEYYAELDFIESVELIKQDYEEEAYRSDDDTTTRATVENVNKKPLSADSNQTTPKTTSSSSTSMDVTDQEDESSIRSRLRKRDVEINYKKMEDDAVHLSDEEDLVVREPSSFNPESDRGTSFGSKYPSVRTLYGRNESVYIMDAKSSGNLGRFLNHSCSPNVYVQNVFVDTHDLRFPWVSFFAMQFIRAGTELTWNYNYDVGSVEDKVLYCNCGSANCKGRLL